MKRYTTRRLKGTTQLHHVYERGLLTVTDQKSRGWNKYIPHTVQTSNTTPTTADNGKMKVKI